MTPQPPRRAAVHGGWEQLLRRLATNVNDLGEELAARMRAMSDKREKLLRKRLRAKRWSIRWALACVAGLLVTTVLATTGAPPWLLIIPALLTAGCAIPATYLLVRYRYLKAEPLPPPRREWSGDCRPTGPQRARRWRPWTPPNDPSSRCSVWWNAAA